MLRRYYRMNITAVTPRNLKCWFFLSVVILTSGIIYLLSNSSERQLSERNKRLNRLIFHNDMKFPAHKKPSAINGTLKVAMMSETDITHIDKLINASKHNIKSPNIPNIIHQTWDTYQIPRTFIVNIESWLKHHPSWKYWFWTTKAIRCFIEKNYPKSFAVYDAYPDATSRADAMRYFVLHKYGGFYVDIDTKCLKPLDFWSQNFCCILTEEPYEHSFIVRRAKQSNIVNSPLACVSKHRLYETAITSLPEYAARYLGDYLKSTGPEFLQIIYNEYKKQSTTISSNNKCLVTVIPPKYFLPKYDPSQSEIIDDICSVGNYKSLPWDQMKICTDLLNRNYKNDVTDAAFMDHKWIHVALLGPDWKDANTVNFFDIFPNAKNLEQMFCKQ